MRTARAIELPARGSRTVQTLEPALNGIRVLVDAYNLRLEHGTGIRRYGQTLVHALKGLGAEVGLLTDRATQRSRYAELHEVLFFDARGGQAAPTQRWKKGLRLARAALGFRRPEEIPLRNVVAPIDQLGDVSVSYVWNLQACFDLANRLFQHTGLVTPVRARRTVKLWHATYPLPITVPGARHVTTIHDLIPLRLPHTTLDDKEFFFRLVRESLKRSDVVIAVSEHTRADILQRFSVAPEKVVVVHQPVPEPTLHPAPEVENVLRRHRLSAGRYLLFVGNIEPKKNLGRLLEAYRRLETELPLVVVGRKAWLWEQELRAAEPLLSARGKTPPRVRLLGFVPRAELEVLYAHATLLAFPSLYEGFGLPPLEAMSYGCPVITSETSAMPELCGDAALYVDPYSVADLRAKLTRLLESPTLRRELAKKGRAQVQRFRPENYQRRLAAAYQRVL